jgi:hypothetical protein
MINESVNLAQVNRVGKNSFHVRFGSLVEKYINSS